MSRFVWVFAAVIAVICLQTCYSERNGAEEAICQPFLTSRETSPLNGRLVRDLKVDEDGEFACLVVLQDQTLPLQIRVTIHEGLFWLGVRHVAMSEDGHPMIIFHLDALTKLLPKVAHFHMKAAEWALEPYLSDYAGAIKYLGAVVNGSASGDSSLTERDRYAARRMYAKALGYLGRYDDAKAMYKQLVHDYPNDFHSAYLLTDAMDASAAVASSSSATGSLAQQTVDGSEDELSALLQSTKVLYTDLSHCCVKNSYAGFTIPSASWQPQRLGHLLSAVEFQEFIDRREPFVISLGDKLDAQLGWNTQRWRNREYLRARAGRQRVQVEYQALVSDRRPRQLGFGVSSYRKVLDFADFLSSYRDQDKLAYLNVQIDGLKREDDSATSSSNQTIPDYYNPPLNRVIDDIPLPDMLQNIERDLTQVNLWMNPTNDSGAADAVTTGREMTSRLHMDATDNLYVVVQGKKRFEIVSPADATKMQTILPTIAVAPNGLSFRYNSITFGLDDESVPAPPDYAQDINLGHFSTLPDASHAKNSADSVGVHVASIELQEGDLLYLPTGWFHQVTSKPGAHKAVNYWWKPSQWKDMVNFEKEAATEAKVAYHRYKQEKRDDKKEEL